MTQHKKYSLALLIVTLVVAGVVFAVWKTHPATPGSTSIKNITTTTVTQSIPKVETSNTLFTETQNATHPMLLKTDDTNILLFRNSEQVLQKISLTRDGKENGTPENIPDLPYGINKEKIAQLNNDIFLFYERTRDERTEWILEKRSPDFHAQKTTVLTSAPAQQPSTNQTFLTHAVLTTDAETQNILLLTPVTENQKLSKVHVQIFDTNLKSQGEKDLTLPEAELFGTDFDAFAEKKNITLFFTEYRKGERCPQLTKSSITDILAASYQEQNTPVKTERLTKTETLAHHPRVIGTHEGKILVSYFTQRSQDPYPNCTNETIPPQGPIHLLSINSNLALLNDAVVNDAKVGLPGLGNGVIHDDTMYMTYELRRERSADAKAAIIFDRLNFTLQTKTWN